MLSFQRGTIVKFYVVTLSIYSVAVTILAGLLMMQNRELKMGPAPEPIDYETVHTLDLQDVPMKGATNAPVTIIEYSDFECPACARSSKEVHRIVAKYGDKVRLGYKHLPLPMHPNAPAAAAVSMAAHRQGKFWEMEEKLFANYSSLNDETYTRLAQEIGLNMEEFETQKGLDIWQGYIDMHMEEAKELQITGTPTFFVNGVRVMGVNRLEEVIEHVLKNPQS